MMAAPSPFNRQRRGTSPALFQQRERKPAPPVGPLDLPNPSFLNDLTGSFGGRSITDSPSEDGDDEQNHVGAWGDPGRNRSNSAATGFAEFAALVTSAVSSITPQPRSPSFKSNTPSEAEIEAEAIREREHSRREAERILLQEAEERRRAEERRNALWNASTPRNPNRRRDTIDAPSTSPQNRDAPSTPPSKGSRWWSIAKQKLTPTKDEDAHLTPAQEIIRETKQKQKEWRKEDDDERGRMKPTRDAWSASPKVKNTDPILTAMQSSSPSHKLSTPAGSPRPIQSNSPKHLHSPMTPPQVPQAISTTHVNFSPSGARPSAVSRPSESEVGNSMYNQFNPHTGALDIPTTLLTITARFEKLERWTVNHVRALEERMKDVERYLVDRETREDAFKKDLNNMKTAMLQVKSEMQQLQAATSPIYVPLRFPPSPLPAEESLTPPDPLPAPAPMSASVHPRAQAPEFASVRQPSPILSPAGLLAPSPIPASPMSIPSISASSTGVTSTSTSVSYHSAAGSPYDAVRPSMPRRSSQSSTDGTEPTTNASPSGSETADSASALKAMNFRSKFPYPTGDYYDLPMSNPQQSSTVSTISSAPPVTDRSQTASPALLPPRSVSPLALTPVEKLQQMSPQDRAKAPLVAPKVDARARLGSKTPSPTPRKRYTVALSGRQDDNDRDPLDMNDEEQSIISARKVQTALITDSPPPLAIKPSLTSFSASTSSQDSSVTDSSTSTATSETSPEFRGPGNPDTTIGSTVVNLSRLSLSPPSRRISPGLASPVQISGRSRALSTMDSTRVSPSPRSASPSPRSARKRAQSTAQDGPPPLSSRLARLGLNETSVTPSSGSRIPPNSSSTFVSREQYSPEADVFSKSGFVDPLVIRKKEKERRNMETKLKQDSLSSAASSRKIPVAKLAAYFDADAR